MRLSVGTNWDHALINALAAIPEVYEVYGSTSMTPVGTGRPSFLLGKISEGDMAEYVAKLHARGLKFNYTLNAPCMNNLEYDRDTHRSLIRYLGWLASIGVDIVTVSIPYLLEIVKAQFPQFQVKVSTIAHVNSVEKARFFEGLGADEITLDYMINRDFKLLEKIRKTVTCDLSLLLNDCCFYECPFRLYHYNICGHASQTGHSMGGFYVDYCVVRCSLMRARDPRLLMTARWIRPEDLHHYEDIGYDFFKVSGRRMSTRWIHNAAQAYASRRYDGDLADLLDLVSPGVEDDVHSPQYQTIVSGAEFLKAERLLALAQFYPVKPHIDNQALEGFIDFFKKQDCTLACAECTHCETYAKKAVRIDESESRHYLGALEDLLEDLTTSRIFLGADEEVTPETKRPPERAELGWALGVEQEFLSVMDSVPEALRQVAHEVVSKRALANAKERGATMIEEEDMVRAFLSHTPGAFRPAMLASLEALGIDLSKYPSEGAD